MCKVPDISVIVPFYNAECTLERTLKSLASQTLETVEYVFVDDGSTDRSVGILHDFMARNPGFKGRHRLVTSSHKGTAHAMSVGYRIASGVYVMRCDADDYLESDALEVLLGATSGSVADMVLSPIFYDKDGTVKALTFNSEPASLNDMRVDTLHFSLCNKLLRRKWIVENDIFPFEGVDCWEDLGVVARFMALDPQVTFVCRPLYHYVVDTGVKSLSRSRSDRLLRDHLKMALLLEQWFVLRGLDVRFEEFLSHLKFYAKVKMLRGRDVDVVRWKNTFPEVNVRIMGLRHLQWYWKVLFGAVALLPSAFVQAVADCRNTICRYR